MLVLVCYIFFPFDLIPDSFGLIGYVDDLFMVFGVIYWICERFMGGFRNNVNADFSRIRVN